MASSCHGSSSKLASSGEAQALASCFAGLLEAVRGPKWCVFLSHAKRDASTEAKLLYEHYRGLHDGRSLFAPRLFLDEMHLDDLSGLVPAVRSSRSLVLMLTKHVFERGWVLLEVVTAVAAGVKVVPVVVQKKGCEFQAPNEHFFTSLGQGHLLDAYNHSVLQDHNITLQQACEAVRKVLGENPILQYSPYGDADTRMAELVEMKWHTSRR